MKIYETTTGKSYRTPFLLVSSLFFLWGFAHAILEVLNPHFKDLLHLSHQDAAWVQAATYGAYFFMALPAGLIIRRFGYRGGVLSGLGLYGLGALLFLPICLLGAGSLHTDLLYVCFIGALLIIGCGLTCLETSANAYITVLGDASAAERRINLSQSLNGLGWICGPLIGGLIFFGADSANADSTSGILRVALPYTVVGIVVLLVGVVFRSSELPEVGQDDASVETSDSEKPLYRQMGFVFGVLALFLYVAAQTGVNSNFVSYMTSTGTMDANVASRWLGFGGMGLFLLGRLVGAWLMNYIRPSRLLALLSVGATLSSLVVIYGGGYQAMIALFVIYLCESIMFPTIFALSLRGLQGAQVKMASSILIMTIVGGAVAPLLMGHIADHSDIATAFWVPLICYSVIAAFGMQRK